MVLKFEGKAKIITKVGSSIKLAAVEESCRPRRVGLKGDGSVVGLDLVIHG